MTNKARTGNTPLGPSNTSPTPDIKPAKKTKKLTKKEKLLPTVIALSSAGFGACEISEQTGISRISVWKWLKSIPQSDKEYHKLKQGLADQFVAATLDNLNLSARMTKHLVELPENKLKEMNPVNIAVIKRASDVGAGIMHDKYRLESDQSTDNVSILVGGLRDLQARRRGESVDNSDDNQVIDVQSGDKPMDANT